MTTSTPTRDTDGKLAHGQLADLRREIDAIDDHLHGLLMRRTELVEAIANAKGSDGRALALRPAREAQVLRRLADGHEGRFPIQVMLRIWREVMSAFAHLQGPFRIVLCAPEENPAWWDMARGQFGSMTPITVVRGARSALGAVTEDPWTVAVVPWPQDEESDPWWPGLMTTPELDSPRIFAALPYVPNAATGDRRAMAVARVGLEASGHDQGLIALEFAQDVSRSRVSQVLRSAGLAPVAMWSDGARGQLGPRLLVQTDSFVAAADPRLDAVTDGLEGELDRLVVVGTFPTPLEVDQPA